MKRDCMFQYATKNRVFDNTGLITLSDAIELFNDRKELFKEHLKDGLEPEMAVWIDCATTQSYGESLHHWRSDDFIIFDGALYKLELTE